MNTYQKITQYILGIAVIAYFSFLLSYIINTDQTAQKTQEPEEVIQGQNTSTETPKSVRTTATVTRIIDGDTIQLSTGEKLRYIGIDTPELSGKDACFAQEAAQKNSELVLNKKVELEKDVSEKDRYGRLLRYVYIEDKMINYELVSQGYAFASKYPPDIKNQELFEKAQEQAHSQKRGFWGNKCDY
jgi:micrococcal nuclease